MGILIRGMEMPKSCSDCPLCYGMMECSISDIKFFNVKEQVFDFRTSCTERHPNCPLVFVPPHGDLVDKDKLKKQMSNLAESYGWWFVLCNTPTIIPAEDGE